MTHKTVLIHKYNTDRPFPNADEYWTFAFYGWLLLEHDDGSLMEVEANYATSNQVRIEQVLNGVFSGNYDDYSVVGYKIKPELLTENRPPYAIGDGPVRCHVMKSSIKYLKPKS